MVRNVGIFFCKSAFYSPYDILSTLFVARVFIFSISVPTLLPIPSLPTALPSLTPWGTISQELLLSCISSLTPFSNPLFLGVQARTVLLYRYLKSKPLPLSHFSPEISSTLLVTSFIAISVSLETQEPSMCHKIGFSRCNRPPFSSLLLYSFVH